MAIHPSQCRPGPAPLRPCGTAVAIRRSGDSDQRRGQRRRAAQQTTLHWHPSPARATCIGFGVYFDKTRGAAELPIIKLEYQNSDSDVVTVVIVTKMELSLETYDGCTYKISPELAAKSEFIQGAIEESTTSKVSLKLSHQSCTLLTIRRIVHLLSQYLELPINAGFDDAIERITVQNLEDLGEEEVMEVIVASDVLDIQIMRELLGKRPGTLHAASRFDSPSAIRALLEGKASIDARDIDSRTPLHRASAVGNMDSLSALLEASAVVNVHDRFQQSPLHLAASGGWIAVAEMLLNASARPDAIDWCRQTPMHLAAAAGRDSVLRALIRYGASMDPEDGIGQTPLHLCAASGKAASARLLVEMGVR
jgi:hypothetical protein